MFNAPVWWNGRHKGLKIPRWQQRTGSSPVTGTTSEGANTVPFPPCGENCTMLAPSSFSKSNPRRWASIWLFYLFSKSTDFGIGSRSTRPRSGDGGVSRLVPVGDSSPRITNIPHDANVTGDAAFYSTSTTPSSLTVTVMPVLTYSRNSSPSWSTTGIFASVQTSASIAPDAARESIGMLKSMHAG